MTCTENNGLCGKLFSSELLREIDCMAIWLISELIPKKIENSKFSKNFWNRKWTQKKMLVYSGYMTYDSYDMSQKLWIKFFFGTFVISTVPYCNLSTGYSL